VATQGQPIECRGKEEVELSKVCRKGGDALPKEEGGFPLGMKGMGGELVIMKWKKGLLPRKGRKQKTASASQKRKANTPTEVL